MVTTKLNLSMTEPQVRQIYAKQGDTGRVLDISLDQTPEDGTLRILRPDGTEVTSEAVTGGEVSESGETVTFDSLTEADVTELTVGIEPVQDLSHGDPSPTNICPISGWTGCNVTRTGKNLLSGLVQGGLNNQGNLVPSTANRVSTADFIPVKPGETYTISGSTNVSGRSAKAYVLEFSTAGRTDYVKSEAWTVLPMTFTAVSSAKYIKIMVGLTYDTDLTPANIQNAQIELGSTATLFEPFKAIDVYPISWQSSAGTVYGGTLDVTSGVLTVDRAMVDMGSLNWGRYNEIQNAYVYLASLVSQGMDTSSAKLLSSVFKCRDSWTSLTNLANGEMQSHPSLAYAYARCDSYTTASDFKTAVTGQQLVYELATPLTYTLTAQQIKTLVGTNNVWASSGDIVSITFTYGGLLSELPSEATEIVGKCYCDVEQNGVSSMPFTLNVKKNERES